MITPFDSDFKIDYPALRRVIDHVIDNGADYLVILGTTGETPTLTAAEKAEVRRRAVEYTAGRVPLIAGMGGNCTAALVDEIHNTDLTGYSAILSVTPFYNKPSQEGLYRHFAEVARVSTLPVVLYNVPGRTGVNIMAETTLRLAHEFPDIIAIKEASGNISYATTVARYLSDDFRMLSGNDDMVVPILSLGGSGVISVWADVCPQAVHDMCANWFAGNTQAALATQLENLELIHSLFCEVNPIPVKAALAKMGMIGETYRSPLYTISDAGRERLYAAMRGAGLID